FGVLHGDHVIGEVLTEAGGGQDRGALLGGSRRGGRADIEIGHEVSFLGNVGAGQRVRISTSGGTASRQGTSRPRTSTTTSSFFFNPASSPMNASAMPVLRVGEKVPELVTPTSRPPARTVWPARRIPRPVTSSAYIRRAGPAAF